MYTTTHTQSRSVFNFIFKKILAIVITLTSLLLASCSNTPTGATGTVGNITIKDAWVRAALVAGSDGFISSGYMTIKNKGNTPDALMSVSSADAATVEIHESKSMDGMMSMAPLPDGLEIPANGSMTLTPGSYHLTIMQPKKESFTPGKTVKFLFKFKSGSELALDVPVRENK